MAQQNPAPAGLRVGVVGSIMYLNGCRVDYVETLEGAVIDALEAGRDKGGRQ